MFLVSAPLYRCMGFTTYCMCMWSMCSHVVLSVSKYPGHTVFRRTMSLAYASYPCVSLSGCHVNQSATASQSVIQPVYKSTRLSAGKTTIQSVTTLILMNMCPVHVPDSVFMMKQSISYLDWRKENMRGSSRGGRTWRRRKREEEMLVSVVVHMSSLTMDTLRPDTYRPSHDDYALTVST